MFAQKPRIDQHPESIGGLPTVPVLPRSLLPGFFGPGFGVGAVQVFVPLPAVVPLPLRGLGGLPELVQLALLRFGVGLRLLIGTVAGFRGRASELVRFGLQPPFGFPQAVAFTVSSVGVTLASFRAKAPGRGRP